MEPNPVRLAQGDKRRRDRRSRGVENVRFEEKRRINQDWDYLQAAQLPQNAPTDQIFNAAYHKQGLQPQDLSYQNSNQSVSNSQKSNQIDGSEHIMTTGKDVNYTRFGKNTTDRTIKKRGGFLDSKIDVATKNLFSSPLAKGVLAKGRVTTVNIGIYSVGSFIYTFIQLPLAIICFFSFVTYLVVLEGLGIVEGVVAWWFDIKDIVGPLFVITLVTLHVLGLLILTLLYSTYSAAKLKPLSGNMSILKQAAFAAALLLYSTPGINLAPWGLLVVWVVTLYPE